MQAADMTFGIEIECFLPNDVVAREGIRVGGYHRGLQVPGLPAGRPRTTGRCSLASRT